MKQLSYKHKVAIAKQFNIIVRAVNDFQLVHWGVMNEDEFNELFRQEREILLHVERLLNRKTIIISDNPSELLLDVENFSEDLRIQLKYCKLNKANELTSRAIIMVSSIFGFAPNLYNPKRDLLELYVA